MISKTQVEAARTGTAWKTATMRGYVKKTVLDEAAYGEDSYKLTFVKADGTEYDFYFHNTSGEDSTTLNLDGELLDHILNPYWQTGDVETFEQVRDGEGAW